MTLVVAVLGLLAGPGQELASCTADGAPAWVVETRDRVLEFDGLARDAVARFGPPEGCVGAVTADFDGTSFGIVRLTFAGGATFEVETQPPETSIATLRVAVGIGSEDEAVRMLADYARGIGLDVDWDAPVETERDGERIRSWSDPDEGLNATASIVLRDGRVVALRLSMAL